MNKYQENQYCFNEVIRYKNMYRRISLNKYRNKYQKQKLASHRIKRCRQYLQNVMALNITNRSPLPMTLDNYVLDFSTEISNSPAHSDKALITIHDSQA